MDSNEDNAGSAGVDHGPDEPSLVGRRTFLEALAGGAALLGLSGLASSAAQGAARPPAFFYAPHEDDELLSMGAEIAYHVAAGRDTHIVYITQGGAARALGDLNGTTISPWWAIRHNPAVEGYQALSVAAMKAARVREGIASAGVLGVPGVKVHVHDLPDGGVTVSAVRSLLLAHYAIAGASHKTISYFYDTHPDHLATGRALRDLAVSDSRFSDARWYVYRPHWGDVPLADSRFHWVNPSEDAKQRSRNAANAYSAWQPRSGAFAVGMHTSGPSFTAMLRDLRNLWHSLL